MWEHVRITVFGATSTTGRVFLEAAERAGHRTTAFVRDPAPAKHAAQRGGPR
ncbi:NmrA family NAD(P)-binding protein [Streptomyces sp. NBC_00063]|uniref:NmrA family NAD(P)-binding protein n=1 Tax=Streptomyces sp. NBC_00063 TaxID=2975638 RepID=UPI003D740BFA